MRILITGGCGFIGSAVVRRLLADGAVELCNVDKLTYAANPEFAELDSPRYSFVEADVGDAAAMARVFASFEPDAVMHLAAESHVDRSIDGPSAFLDTNIGGTFTLLQAARAYYDGLSRERRERFRFHHVSTDEVYGDLEADEPAFTETTPYRPSSPYSASKAASDHLVHAWHRTFGLPVVISNCSNNYGPWQFPEKLVPLMILNAVRGRPLPVYGDGLQVRDWLFVEDHVEALLHVLERGRTGETYNIGGLSELTNIEVVRTICEILEQEHPEKPAGVTQYADLVTHVVDRPGHDRRYAIDCTKIRNELGWQPKQTFETGLRQTVRWYLDNLDWCAAIETARYQGERIGLGSGAKANAA